MLLKVGELAKRCGLTVRALHHYDAIGLLSPSARSESGYRLYNRQDVAKLHQIQALRKFGMSLTDIGACLANSGYPLSSLIARQLHALDRQIEHAQKLRDRLYALHAQLSNGEEPDLAEWLITLELMTMYDKYFTQEELKRLPLYQDHNARSAEWKTLISDVGNAIASSLPASSPEAGRLAKRWMQMLEHDTNSDPRLFSKLNTMHVHEPAVQTQTGITMDMLEYIQQAFAETKYLIYKKYLNADEFRFLRENYLLRANEWPSLIAEIRQHMEDSTPPDAEEVQRLAQRWLDLFRTYAGNDPETQAKFRAAHQAEPELLIGTWTDAKLLAYIRQAISLLK